MKKLMATITKGGATVYRLFATETGYAAENATGEPVSLSVLGEIYRQEWAFVGDCSNKGKCIGKHYTLVAEDLLGAFKVLRNF